MNQTKIGKFIASMRKEQGLSQKQLADQLDVTDKTVSKWETGYRMPDASILLKLSSVLQIDVNELLAGEKFSSEEYVEKSESNIVNLVGELNEIDNKRKSKGIGTILGIVFIVLSFIELIGTSLRWGSFADIFDLPTLFYLLGIKFFIITITGWFHDYLNAWKVCFKRKKLSEKEMHLSVQAIKYAGALSLAMCCLISAIGLFSLLNYTVELNLNGPSFAQTVLALLYTAIEETIYIMMLFRIKRLKGETNGEIIRS